MGSFLLCHYCIQWAVCTKCSDIKWFCILLTQFIFGFHSTLRTNRAFVIETERVSYEGGCGFWCVIWLRHALILNDNTYFVRTAMHTYLFLSLECFEVAYVTSRSQARSVTRRCDHTPHSRNDRTSFAGRGLWCTPCSASGRRYASKIIFWLGFHLFRGQRTYILALCSRKDVQVCISIFFKTGCTGGAYRQHGRNENCLFLHVRNSVRHVA